MREFGFIKLSRRIEEDRKENYNSDEAELDHNLGVVDVNMLFFYSLHSPLSAAK
jgi:hypothetical protein